MLGKLHLICMKTKDFYAKNRCDLNKLDVISPTFHTSVKRRKITFKSLLNPLVCHPYVTKLMASNYFQLYIMDIYLRNLLTLRQKNYFKILRKLKVFIVCC